MTLTSSLTMTDFPKLPRLHISAVMRLYGLTARAVRFYEEHGLVEAQRDRMNQRFYDGVARLRLAWIARLRRADLPLSDIREILGVEDPQKWPEYAAEKVAARRALALAQLADIEAVLDELSGDDLPGRGRASAGVDTTSGRRGPGRPPNRPLTG